MELCWNDAETAESIKEARAICAHVAMDAEALCSSTVKEAKATCTHTIQEAKTTCSVAIRDAETQGPPRLSHSTGNMLRPSSTWRNKSSKKKVRVRLTYSLPVKLPYMPALQNSEVHW